MPGTLIQDANALNLATGATLNAAGTTTSTITEAPYSGKIAIKLATSTVTGTTPTLNVEIQGSDSSTFASGVVSYGRFAQVTASNDTRYLQVYHDKRYIRASVVVGGTTPVFTGTTITPVPPHDKRTAATTA